MEAEKGPEEKLPVPKKGEIYIRAGDGHTYELEEIKISEVVLRRTGFAEDKIYISIEDLYKKFKIKE